MREKVTERIATVGGGTGSFTMLSELKKVATHIWAIVSMLDSGGSSRRLMDEFGRPLPLGDLRQALVALSRSSNLWSSIFSYRFAQKAPGTPNGTFDGHSLGNLILHALEDQNGDLLGAIEDAEELLNAAGHVIPVTLDSATLCAELSDGTIVRGETSIDRPNGRAILPITPRLRRTNRRHATSRARKALERADKVLIGPGDLYTSVIPCLLVEGITEAIRSCDGEIIYICNVMTKHGETDGYAASDFVREVHRYLGRRVDTVIVNTGEYPADVAARYAAEGAYPVIPDLEVVRQLVPRVLTGHFFSAEKLIRHDAERVLLAIWPQLAG